MTYLPFLFTSTASSSGEGASSSGAASEGIVFSWEAFWNTIVLFFRDNVWNIIAWFATLIIGLVLTYCLVRSLRFVMRKNNADEMAVRFVSKTVKFVLWLILIIVLLAIMGVPVTGITTTLSASVLAIGMALKDFLSHVAAGIILILSKSYKKGDYIQINSLEGSIVDINFLFTTLKTYDSTRVTVPNSMMVNNCVTNLEAYGIRRLALHFPIAHDADVDLVRKTLLEVMHSDGRIKLDPAPSCRLSEIKQECLDFLLLCHVDIEDYWDCYFYIWDQGYDALKRAGIHTPYQPISVFQGKEKEEFPIAYKGLKERVEKKHDDDKIYRINLVDYDELSPEEVASIMAHNKRVRAKQRAEKEKNGKKKKKPSKKAKQPVPEQEEPKAE